MNQKTSGNSARSFKKKLVRDKIPDIITKSGKRPVTHIATNDEYWQALLAKLAEEVQECIAADGSIEEIADILEVIDALCKFRNINRAQVISHQRQKRASRGGFTKRIILETTK